MQLHRRSCVTAAIVIAAAGIGGFLVLSWMWCAAVRFEDANMRPLGIVGSYTPPPGPVYLDPDGYCWLGYAQRIARGEDWRIRYTKTDNFPEGREVHWSQVASWSLVLLGKTRALFTREPLAVAVENASVILNPMLFALAALCLFFALSYQFGLMPSALLMAFLGSLGDINWIFQPLRPGHQGFHVVFGSISVLGLIFGGMGLTARQAVEGERWPLFRSPQAVDLPTARRWFTIAGVATGLALWVAATIESFFVYPMIGITIILLILVPPARVAAEGLQVHPELWRRWGWAAGAVGFAFYLIEYFPHHMAMRLEVNHPVYDLAVVGCGEALCALTRWRWGGHRATPTSIVLTGLWLALAALPVLLIKIGPVEWHHMRDPQMLRLHNFIQEFFTLSNLTKTNRLSHFVNSFGVLPFFALFAPFFLLRQRLSATQVIWLWCPFVYACSFFVTSYLLVRWMGFFAASVCLSAMVSAHFAYDLLPKVRVARNNLIALGVVLVLLAQPIEFFRRAGMGLWNDLSGITMEDMNINPIINKRMACALKASPDCPKAIIADPSIAPSLEYFGGMPCLTSFYWENTEGLHKAVRFFTTTDPTEAHEIARSIGATHVIISTSMTMPDYFYYVAHGHYDTAALSKTFAGKLVAGKLPSWIQPDTMLNLITTNSYSYLGHPLRYQMETFRIEN